MTPESESGTTSSSEARRDAQKHLNEVTEQGEKVRGIATRLRELRRRNHFGESIERAMMRRRDYG